MSWAGMSAKSRALLLLAIVVAAYAAFMLAASKLRAAGIEAYVEVAFGVLAAVLAANVIIVAVKSETSRREEDEKTVNDARFVAGECLHIFDLMGKIKEENPDGLHRALDQLAIRVRLLVTQYRAYLKPGAVESLRHAERSILDVQIERRPTSRLMSSLGKTLGELKGGIRSVDDPALAAMRRKV